jgi:hypothetical protein
MRRQVCSQVCSQIHSQARSRHLYPVAPATMEVSFAADSISRASRDAGAQQIVEVHDPDWPVGLRDDQGRDLR